MPAWPLALLPTLATALVPFASIDCMRPWLDGQTHGVVDKQHGRLKPRLNQDPDPITLGLMEADDVACVSSLIADAFGGGIEVIKRSIVNRKAAKVMSRMWLQATLERTRVALDVDTSADVCHV